MKILLSVTSRDHGEVLADALKTLLWEGKQQDMLRAAAFIKRLATFALSFGSAEAIAGLFWRSHFCLSHPFCADACGTSIISQDD